MQLEEHAKRFKTLYEMKKKILSELDNLKSDSFQTVKSTQECVKKFEKKILHEIRQFQELFTHDKFNTESLNAYFTNFIKNSDTDKSNFDIVKENLKRIFQIAMDNSKIGLFFLESISKYFEKFENEPLPQDLLDLIKEKIPDFQASEDDMINILKILYLSSQKGTNLSKELLNELLSKIKNLEKKNSNGNLLSCFLVFLYSLTEEGYLIDVEILRRLVKYLSDKRVLTENEFFKSTEEGVFESLPKTISEVTNLIMLNSYIQSDCVNLRLLDLELTIWDNDSPAR